MSSDECGLEGYKSALLKSTSITDLEENLKGAEM
jgi:hypothetical protein